MREILFRGKRLDNGEWVEGESILINNKYTLIAKVGRLSVEDGILNGIYNSVMYAVDPSTVGQYTGQDDIFCKKIFEGDLCLCDRHINDAFDKKVFEIVYDPVRGFYGENFNEINADEFCMCEIVGNVYDNPELLKGE